MSQKQNVVDCSFRLPGDKPSSRLAEINCGFDPQLKAEPLGKPEKTDKPARPNKVNDPAMG